MKPIRLFKPFMSWRARFYALRVLMGDMIGEGPVVKRFEKEFAERFRFENVVAVNSGTSALELAYELAGIMPGDEVITPVLTCTATNIPLLHRGAKIIFADINYDLNVDINDIEMKITPRTKAIVFVHFGGNNAGLKDLLFLVGRLNKTRKQKIKVIEDAAQAIGSSYWGKADFTAVSFQAIKNLTSVDGGMLICKNIIDTDKAKRLRWYGYDRDLKHKNGDIDLIEAGYKMHMNDLTAAIGLGNLRTLDKPLNHRKKLAIIYKQYGIVCHPWLAIGTLKDNSAMDAFRLHMAFEGVEVGQHHYDNRKYSIFKSFSGECPIMDIFKERYMFFPFHTGVTESQAHRIGKLYQKYR